MIDPSLGFLFHCRPLLANLTGKISCLPSRWLTAGYVPRNFEDGSVGWQKIVAHQGRWFDAQEVDAFYRHPAARQLLQRLSLTLAPFFPLSAEQWEADLRGTFNPITSLYLWETAVDVFDYYVKGKRFSVRARQEYLELLWAFFNHGPDVAAYDGQLPYSLTLGRIKRVVAELERYFQRRKRSTRHHERHEGAVEEHDDAQPT